MPQYTAFLGHQPHISLAELCMTFSDLVVKKLWTPHIVTFETKAEIDSGTLEGLGGTVLIAKKIEEGIPAKKIEDRVPVLLHRALKEVKRKATFSFRCFGVPRSITRNLYRNGKKYLKEKELSSRYIGNERHPAKPGTLLLRGIPGPSTAEIVILQDEKKKEAWVGETCAVHDIEAYTERDMGKPFRDTKTGLLPPKLAQILLNFGVWLVETEGSDGAKRDGDTWESLTMWDPFCGSGVIVLEALHRRAHVLGSDKTQKAVDGCQENVTWLRKKEKTPKAITSTVWKSNALKVKEEDLARMPSMIVTETSLGPALKKTPTKKEVTTYQKEADELISGFFENTMTIAPDTPIVCTFPVYITRDGNKHYLEKTLQKISKLGYRLTCVSEKNVKLTERSTLLYLRPDQHVGREIACFLPPKQ